MTKAPNKKTKIFLATITSIVLVLFFVFFAIGFYLGDRGTVIIEDPENTLFERDFSIFWEVVNAIKKDYYRNEEIDETKLIYGAIEGMVRSLGDPYSLFFNPEDAKTFEEDVSGSFGGVGIEIGIRDNRLTIISPLKGTPGDRAGLKSGDRILKVDDVWTEGINLQDAVKAIRGEVGKAVELLIMREGWEEPKEFTVVRAIIEVPTLDWEMLDDKIGYIQLYNFNANAAKTFQKASFELLFSGARGLILDLRNNSGGFLEIANNLAGWFLERGEIVVVERFSSGETKNFVAAGNNAWKGLPVVILVNQGSASASEILAGALKHHIGAPLVGETTFGKGTVQQLKSLRDGSTLKISIAEWITPGGESISDNGIEPDYVVELTEEDIELGEDPQFDKALEIMKEKAKNIESIPRLVP